MFKFFIHLTILSFFLIFSSYAKNYERIIINGNERISSETILVFSEISEDQSLNENSINNILKKVIYYCSNEYLIKDYTSDNK